MISHILSIIALAAATLASCPLSVEIANATNHIAYIAVTNTGNETLTVFKGNTVFSDHATLDLLVTDAGMSAEFLNLNQQFASNVIFTKITIKMTMAKTIINTIRRWYRAPL